MITTAPPVRFPDHVPAPAMSDRRLRHGLRALVLPHGATPLSEVRLIAPVGRFHQPAHQVARLAGRLLREGSAHHTADDVAEILALHGAELRVVPRWHTTEIRLSALREHMDVLLPLLGDMVRSPAFDADELARMKRREARSLRIRLRRNDYLATRHALGAVFGSDHAFGYIPDPSELEALTPTDLVNHWRAAADRPLTVAYAGRVDDGLPDLIDRHLAPEAAPTSTLPVAPVPDPRPMEEHIDGPSHAQTSIAVTRVLPPVDHPDAHDIHFVNLLLGGYFGSRLMRSIREEKGYTYGIHAQILPLPGFCLQHISTDVGSEHTRATLDEIRSEMLRLQEEDVPEHELTMARNYAIGQLMRSVDGPFKTARMLRDLTLLDLDLRDRLDARMAALQAITPRRIREVSRKYLTFEDTIRISVG